MKSTKVSVPYPCERRVERLGLQRDQLSIYHIIQLGTVLDSDFHIIRASSQCTYNFSCKYTGTSENNNRNLTLSNNLSCARQSVKKMCSEKLQERAKWKSFLLSEKCSNYDSIKKSYRKISVNLCSTHFFKTKMISFDTPPP